MSLTPFFASFTGNFVNLKRVWSCNFEALNRVWNIQLLIIFAAATILQIFVHQLVALVTKVQKQTKYIQKK